MGMGVGWRVAVSSAVASVEPLELLSSDEQPAATTASSANAAATRRRLVVRTSSPLGSSASGSGGRTPALVDRDTTRPGRPGPVVAPPQDGTRGAGDGPGRRGP